MHTTIHATRRSRRPSGETVRVLAPWALTLLVAVSAALFSAAAGAATPPTMAATALSPHQDATPPLRFADALQLALQRDGDLQSARAAVRAAQAQVDQLRSRFFPSAGVQYEQGRRVTEEGGTPVDRHLRSTEGFVRWNVYNGGADKTQLDAAMLELQAVQADARQALEDACERLAKAYIELQRQQALLQAAQRRHAELADLVERVGRQVAAGKSPSSDGDLAQSSLIDAQLSVASSQADLLAAQAQLGVLTGQAGALRAETMPPGATPWPSALALAPEAPLEDWWALALRGNASAQAAAARREAARARVPLIASEYLPKADLTLSKTLSDRTAPVESTQSRRGWTLTVSYEVPLGGGGTARREEARARAEAAESQAWRSEQAVRGELGVVRQQMLQSARALPAVERQLTHLEATVRASDLQYQAGRRSLLQLIDQRDRRFSAEQRQVDASWRQRQALLRLSVLTGSLSSMLGVAQATSAPTEAFRTPPDPGLAPP